MLWGWLGLKGSQTANGVHRDAAYRVPETNRGQCVAQLVQQNTHKQSDKEWK